MSKRYTGSLTDVHGDEHSYSLLEIYPRKALPYPSEPSAGWKLPTFAPMLREMKAGSPRKHLCSDQMVQPMQLNHTLEWLSELVISFVNELWSPHQSPSCCLCSLYLRFWYGEVKGSSFILATRMDSTPRLGAFSSSQGPGFDVNTESCSCSW